MVPPLPRAERLAHHRPVLGFAALAEREATRAALGRAANEASVRVLFLRVLPRTRPGRELLEKDGALEGVAASREELASALGEALARLADHDVLVLEGPTGMGQVRCDLTLLVTHGVPVSEWSADLRTLRPELGLLLEAPREQTFAHLFRGLLRGPTAARANA